MLMKLTQKSLSVRIKTSQKNFCSVHRVVGKIDKLYADYSGKKWNMQGSK